MARISGKSGRLYAAVASGGLAEPIAFINSWDITFATDKQDVTAFGDLNKQYVSGLPDAQGNYAGFYDNATAQMYTAATDGVARKFYFYPDQVGLITQYFHGLGIFDFSIKEGIGGGVEISGGWAAASTVVKVG